MTQKDLYKYKGQTLRIVDGDTAVALVSLGMKVYKQVILRLARINSAELNSKDQSERKKALDAKAFLTTLIGDREIFFNSTGLDSYDRSIADIYINGVCINDLMVSNGFAEYHQY